MTGILTKATLYMAPMGLKLATSGDLQGHAPVMIGGKRVLQAFQKVRRLLFGLDWLLDDDSLENKESDDVGIDPLSNEALLERSSVYVSSSSLLWFWRLEYIVVNNDAFNDSGCGGYRKV